MRVAFGLLVFGTALLPLAGAHADTHSVTVRNGAADTIRGIQIGPAGRLGENRMRSQLPPGAEARVTYSTGCQADVRLTYASGQTEDHAGLDLCSDPRIVAGQSGTAGPVGAVSTPISAPGAGRSGSGGASGAQSGSQAGAKPSVTSPQVAKIPVPPWTGRSITRRFGGME